MTTDARCPYCQCRGGFDNPVRCPGCGAIVHRDCWTEYRGCAVPGCAQAPTEPAPATSPPMPTAPVPGTMPGVPPPPPPPPSPMPAASAPPQGWFPDPGGSGRLRWWTGTAWTDHLHPPTRG